MNVNCCCSCQVAEGSGRYHGLVSPETMIEYAARLLRFADELEEGGHPRASLLRHGVEAVLTLVGSIDRDASMAGHEGPSSTDADELRHQGDKVIQFACALGFDAVDEVGVLDIMLVCDIWKKVWLYERLECVS